MKDPHCLVLHWGLEKWQNVTQPTLFSRHRQYLGLNPSASCSSETLSKLLLPANLLCRPPVPAPAPSIFKAQ